MFLNNAKFITSMNKYHEEVLEDIPQIAVVGKSNVGKSSFINCITNNSKLCKVGNTPGKTRLINFFKIENAFYFVDLPGYGYAKRSKKELTEWAEMIEEFFNTSTKLKYIILLVDIRNNPTKGDVDMLDWIKHFNYEPIIIATKADKVAKTKKIPTCKNISNFLEYDGEILPIDSCSNYGRDVIVEKIKNIIY